jgi:drug/metabolite transporter (DMT)-like permease
MIHILALLGVLSISFSAVFIRLAAVSPVTATFYRAAYAVPILVLVAWTQSGRRSTARRTQRERWLAFASGLILAVDLALWHESIALVGAGLGTVIANVQVVFVALAAWLFHRERPTRQTVWTIALVLLGVGLTSGLARDDAYGSNPGLGAAIGVVAGGLYAAFLLVFRAANRSLAPVSGPLLDSTVGTVIGALACALFDRHFTLTPTVMAHLWLALLAIFSQVIGWLLISAALPRLPAVETSVILLVQPVFAVIWGLLFFGERQSTLQWIGSAIVLAGVAALSGVSHQSSVASQPEFVDY